MLKFPLNFSQLGKYAETLLSFFFLFSFFFSFLLTRKTLGRNQPETNEFPNLSKRKVKMFESIIPNNSPFNLSVERDKVWHMAPHIKNQIQEEVC